MLLRVPLLRRRLMPRPRPPVVVLLDQPVQQLLLTVRARDVVQHLLALLAGRLDDQRAGTHDPIPQRLAECDVGDALQGDVATGVGENAAADQHPMSGEDVVAGAPAHPRCDRQEAQQDDPDHQDRDQGDGAPGAAVGCEGDAGAGAGADHEEPQGRCNQRHPVRVEPFDDLLLGGENALRIRHGDLLTSAGQGIRSGRSQLLHVAGRNRLGAPIGLDEQAAQLVDVSRSAGQGRARAATHTHRRADRR